MKNQKKNQLLHDLKRIAKAMSLLKDELDRIGDDINEEGGES